MLFLEQEVTLEKAVLVGCQTSRLDDGRFQYSMEELSSLTETAKGEVLISVVQKENESIRLPILVKGKLRS